MNAIYSANKVNKAPKLSNTKSKISSKIYISVEELIWVFIDYIKPKYKSILSPKPSLYHSIQASISHRISPKSCDSSVKDFKDEKLISTIQFNLKYKFDTNI